LIRDKGKDTAKGCKEMQKNVNGNAVVEEWDRIVSIL